jgi:hypothetical protein
LKKLAQRSQNIDERQVVEIFVTGLRSELRRMTPLTRPATLDEAIPNAQKCEAIDEEDRCTRRLQEFEVDNVNEQTPRETRDLMRCFSCGNTGHFSRDCTLRRSQRIQQRNGYNRSPGYGSGNYGSSGYNRYQGASGHRYGDPVQPGQVNQHFSTAPPMLSSFRREGMWNNTTNQSYQHQQPQQTLQQQQQGQQVQYDAGAIV